MMLQQTSPGAGALGGATGVLIVLGIVLGVLWMILPFAVFGVKGHLRSILEEQKRTTAAINSLKSELKSLAREPVPMVRGRSTASSAETMIERR